MAGDEREDGSKRVRVRHLLTVSLWGMALVLVVLYFDAVTTLILGLIAAGAMAAALFPLTERIRRPRWLRAIVVGLIPPVVLVALIALLSTALAGHVHGQIQQWPQSREQINSLLAKWSERFGLEEPVTTKVAIQQGVLRLTGGDSEVFTATAETVTGLTIALAFVFFGSIYLLTEPSGRLLVPIEQALPE